MSLHTQNIRYLFIILTATALCLHSCTDKKNVIPKDTMSHIYYDIYMTDEAMDANYSLKRMADTMKIYEPIFNKYGYTTEDYNRSVNFYLERPDRFEDIFENTKNMLEKRKAELNAILEAEGKRPRLWSLVDSLELYTSEGVHAGMIYKYMRMMFFKPDSTVPMSPVIDSTFLERPTNQILIFSDSALNADKNFTFYSTLGFMNEVNRLLEIQDSIRIRQDSIAKAKKAAELDVLQNNKHNRQSVIQDLLDKRQNPTHQRQQIRAFSTIRNNKLSNESKEDKK